MIEIVPYRDTWPGEFHDIASRLRAAAGDVAIHHIGSTSGPGLDAKDVIDIQITVADLAAAAGLSLEAAGFTPTRLADDHCPPGRSLPPAEPRRRPLRSNQVNSGESTA